jgi:hypothetical protein
MKPAIQSRNFLPFMRGKVGKDFINRLQQKIRRSI